VAIVHARASGYRCISGGGGFGGDGFGFVKVLFFVGYCS
jgi:hypothetical protein